MWKKGVNLFPRRSETRAFPDDVCHGLLGYAAKVAALVSDLPRVVKGIPCIGGPRADDVEGVSFLLRPLSDTVVGGFGIYAIQPNVLPSLAARCFGEPANQKKPNQLGGGGSDSGN